MLAGLFFVIVQNIAAQELTLAAFLKQVADNHPFIKQSDLRVRQAIAKLLKAKGSLDPKISFDKNQKQFQNKPYFNQNQIQLKIPTRWGIALKSFYQRNTGVFLNPSENTPQKGLYGLGVSIPLAQGLLNNQRITEIKQAKLFQQQSLATQQMAVNQMLYEATVSYIDWIFAQRKLTVYQESLENAKQRLDNVRINFRAGDKSAMDTLESSVFLNSQRLAYQKAQLDLIAKKISVSNFLWSEQAAPLALKNTSKADTTTLYNIKTTLDLSPINWAAAIENHPKIKALTLKSESVALSKKLALNQMLPKVDLQYNWLSQYNAFSPSFDNEQYKWGLKVSMPLFLRKQRANFKIAKYKLQDLIFETKQAKNSLRNKARRLEATISAYQTQLQIARQTAQGYEKLTQAEIRKMRLGDSNIFTVNYRATKSIESNLKWIDVENKLLKGYAKIFQLKAQIGITD